MASIIVKQMWQLFPFSSTTPPGGRTFRKMTLERVASDEQWLYLENKSLFSESGRIFGLFQISASKRFHVHALQTYFLDNSQCNMG